ncbi:MAG: GspE/PulE family protein [Patescibacteria group bacterium]
MPTNTTNQGTTLDPLVEALLEGRYISQTQYADVQKKSSISGLSEIDVISEENLVPDEEFAKVKSRIYGVPFMDLFGKMIRSEILNIISQELAQNYQMVAFDKKDNEVSIAMLQPNDFKALEATEFLARKNQYKIKYYVTSKGALNHVIKQYATLSEEVEQALQGTEAEARAAEEGIELEEKGLEEVIKKAPVSKMVSVILRHAVEGRASDVHIEPVGNETRVRYRIDGVLHTSLILPKHVHPSVVARIKVLSNLKIDETRIPQDGRFRMNIDGKDIDYRVSTLPLINYEKVVMRILDTTEGSKKLEDLGFDGRNAEVMRENIIKSHGMFLVTGPTGSGKSTTLYSILTVMNQEGVNIVTLEDPVEYYLAGINQSQINAEVGLTFARGLRAILRQDPDVIMVGEIRDNETAELAVHASLTGHIVLSTLHTNDAFGAVPRLIDMKIEPFLVASSTNVIIAQRLVRKICNYCPTEMNVPEAFENEIWSELEKIPKSAIPKDLIIARPLKFYKGQGCARCEHTGYKSRVAISEVLEINEQLEKIIMAGSNTDEIKAEFKKQGMISMKEDGIIKALQGKTTIQEVWNVTRE